MALGTITALAPRANYVTGNRRSVTWDVQCTSGANYTTGGSRITPSQVGLSKKIEESQAEGEATTTSGTTSRPVHWKHNTDGSVNLLVDTTYGVEASAGTDLSTFSVRVTFVGW